MKLDALIFAAHPDDAELSMGGTIAKLTKAGKKVGIVDFTQGELGSRGTIETRKNESEKASEILEISVRINFKHPDGKVRFDDDLVEKSVRLIRQYKPQVIFAPYFNDRHPDHIGVSEVIKNAYFFSGNYKYNTELDSKKQEVYRPKKLYYYAQSYEFKPSFIVDISDTFETKMEAVKAYSTQFHNPEVEGPVTFISKPGFINYLESRAQVAGFKIGKDYGEPFFCEEEIELDIKNMLLE